MYGYWLYTVVLLIFFIGLFLLFYFYFPPTHWVNSTVELCTDLFLFCNSSAVQYLQLTLLCHFLTVFLNCHCHGHNFCDDCVKKMNCARFYSIYSPYTIPKEKCYFLWELLRSKSNTLPLGFPQFYPECKTQWTLDTVQCTVSSQQCKVPLSAQWNRLVVKFVRKWTFLKWPVFYNFL